MRDLLKKLNYKGQQRIAVLGAEENFYTALTNEIQGVIMDKEVDQRCPYGFLIIFVKTAAEVEQIVPVAVHNLTADGIMWFCYPKKTSKNYKSDLERDRGWKVLNDTGFFGVRMVSVDNDWSAIRFRNVKFIKSSSGRFAR